MPRNDDTYSRLTDAMRPQPKDDDPSNLPQEEKPQSYWPYPVPNVLNASDDVSGAAWAMSETYRRLNCRGK